MDWFVAYFFVTKPTDNLKPVQETEKQILKIFWVENKFRNKKNCCFTWHTLRTKSPNSSWNCRVSTDRYTASRVPPRGPWPTAPTHTCLSSITWLASSLMGKGTPSSDSKELMGDRVPLVRTTLLQTDRSEKALRNKNSQDGVKIKFNTCSKWI